ncbi:phytanoyl-CoA dioxygenase family protein [Pyrinomonas methylaliphatogenes]|uniref:Protein involved in biosynthesis of mitomycin antibiotics/polyketide fumonisin n=1 Tax=Pyrinomonas methylaliphatogenes TaxID=454194 RepID=A0A0B6WXX3_9BACT|nr:phytanoyl-CoA dioxygenase family protein [Pyrinomonas methylaliphatogenes]MBX5479034.1 phytanoyl-CoA dioxygenase family protein [Pyrinomonas methylaliphatogenes]CDM66098.1 protein involved in biosynthesis of mitomycin antibiotics/polyketide fumonisin [Pyrinomonas methylaliphatogenes]
MPLPAENLPELVEDYPLTSEQIESYRRDGFILLRGVASEEEVAAYRPLIEEAVYENARRKEPQKIDDYSEIFIQVTNLWLKSEAVRRFVFARRFAKIAAELMGVSGVRLYHDQALFKPPGGKQTPWHQDQVYWPLSTEHTITMWMPLVDAPREIGTMTFAAGSHREGQLGSLIISDEAQRFFERLIAERGFPLVSYDLRAGDATFHAGYVLHCAQANRSDRVREVMTIIYYADGARIMEPDNDYRRVDMEVFHPGQRPGEVAASPLNPLLYQAA